LAVIKIIIEEDFGVFPLEGMDYDFFCEMNFMKFSSNQLYDT
jgi:hypothetical protein